VQSEEGATSNGAGKTRSFDMIPWGVWDQSTTGAAKDELIRIGSDGGYVKILGSIDGKKYKIIRGRGHKKYENKLWVWLDGKPEHRSTDAETKKYLTRLLGYSFASFTNSTFFPQEATNFFAALTDAKRKDLLEQILGLNSISEAKKRAVDDRKKFSKILSDIQSNLSKSRATLDEIEETKERLERMHKDWMKEFKGKKKKLIAERKSAKKELEKLKGKRPKKSSRKLETEKAVIIEKHLNTGDKLKQLADDVATAAGYAHHITTQLGQAEYDLKKLKGTKCLWCKQKLRTKEAKKALRGKLEKKVKTYKKEVTDAKKDEKIARDKHKIAQDKWLALDKKLKTTDKKLDKIRKANENAIRNEERLKSAKANLKQIKKDLKEMKTEKAPFLNQLEYQKEKETKLSAKIEELETKEHKVKKKLFEAEFWEQGFGDAGLKNILLESALAFLENEITNILGQVTHGVFSVKILSTKKLKTKQDGKAPKRMKIDFVIHKGDETRTYNQLSGGQKKRINIAALLALRKLAFIGSGHPTNILILDEPFEYLDGKGMESVLEIIKAANIESVFLISQRELSSEGFDTTIKVKYQNKVSKLEVL